MFQSILRELSVHHLPSPSPGSRAIWLHAVPDGQPFFAGVDAPLMLTCEYDQDIHAARCEPVTGMLPYGWTPLRVPRVAKSKGLADHWQVYQPSRLRGPAGGPGGAHWVAYSELLDGATATTTRESAVLQLFPFTAEETPAPAARSAIVAVAPRTDVPTALLDNDPVPITNPGTGLTTSEYPYQTNDLYATVTDSGEVGLGFLDRATVSLVAMGVDTAGSGSLLGTGPVGGALDQTRNGSAASEAPSAWAPGPLVTTSWYAVVPESLGTTTPGGLRVYACRGAFPGTSPGTVVCEVELASAGGAHVCAMGTVVRLSTGEWVLTYRRFLAGASVHEDYGDVVRQVFDASTTPWTPLGVPEVILEAQGGSSGFGGPPAGDYLGYNRPHTCVVVTGGREFLVTSCDLVAAGRYARPSRRDGLLLHVAERI